MTDEMRMASNMRIQDQEEKPSGNIGNISAEAIPDVVKETNMLSEERLLDTQITKVDMRPAELAAAVAEAKEAFTTPQKPKQPTKQFNNNMMNHTFMSEDRQNRQGVNKLIQ